MKRNVFEMSFRQLTGGTNDSSANAIKPMYSSMKKYSPPSLTRSGDLSFRKEEGSCLPFSFQLNSTLLRECMITRKFHRHSIDIRTLFLLVYTYSSLYGFLQAELSRNLLNFFDHSWARLAFFVSWCYPGGKYWIFYECFFKNCSGRVLAFEIICQKILSSPLFLRRGLLFSHKSSISWVLPRKNFHPFICQLIS